MRLKALTEMKGSWYGKSTAAKSSSSSNKSRKVFIARAAHKQQQ